MKIELKSRCETDTHERTSDDLIKINGKSAMTCKRGLNIVVIDHKTGNVKVQNNYDTHLSMGHRVVTEGGWPFSRSRVELNDYRPLDSTIIANIKQNAEKGDLIVVVVWDEASKGLYPPTKNLLNALDSAEINNLGDREPWLFCCQVTETRPNFKAKKLVEKRGARETSVTGEYEFETQDEITAREMRQRESARNEASRNQTQQAIQTALNAQRDAEQRAQQSQEENLRLQSNNYISTLNSNIQQSTLLVQTLLGSMRDGLNLLTAINEMEPIAPAINLPELLAQLAALEARCAR